MKGIQYKEPLSPPPSRRKQGTLAKNINSICDSLTEFFLPEPTHISSGFGTMSHIDRFAIGTPAWHLALFSTEVHAFAHSSTLNTLHLSDHAIFGIDISAKQPIPSNSHPIPSFITKHRIFKNLIQEALHYFNFASCTLAMHFAELNVIIRVFLFVLRSSFNLRLPLNLGMSLTLFLRKLLKLIMLMSRILVFVLGWCGLRMLTKPHTW